MSGRGSRLLGNQMVVVGLVLMNLGFWIIIVVQGFRHSDIGVSPLITASVGSAITLGLAAALWGDPRHGSLLAVPALRQSLATHQAGHIVAAHNVDPTCLRTMTITGGCSHHTPLFPSVGEKALRAEMTIALGGVVAEELFAGESGTYAAADLRRATDIGVDMVGRYGMTGSPVSLLSAVRGRRGFAKRVFDDARTRKDLETLLREVKQDTVRAMLDKRHEVLAVRDALLRSRRLSPDRIRTIISGADKRRHEDDTVLVDLRIVGNRPAAEA